MADTEPGDGSPRQGQPEGQISMWAWRLRAGVQKNHIEALCPVVMRTWICIIDFDLGSHREVTLTLPDFLG